MAMPTKPKPPGRIKRPQALDRFLPLDFQTLQYVMERGSITMKFDTDNQAMNTKYRLWRLKESLQAYAKGDPLQKASLYFMFKIRKDVLTITDRMRSREYAVQQAAVTDTQEDAPFSADPMEYPKFDWDAIAARLDAEEKEQDNASKASKGTGGDGTP